MIDIPEEMRRQMVEHAARSLPEEACGLLAGRNHDVTARAQRFLPMGNADHSARTYRLDPKDQLRAFNQIEEQGMSLVGIFHSHTHTDAYPSVTDIRQALYPEAHYLLLSLSDRNNPVLRAFTIRDGQIEEQEVRIT